VQTVFTLASGRSGTHFLYELIRRNAADCAARHETYGWNPSMFGRPIDEHAAGNDEPIRKLLARKQRCVVSNGASTYVETSHAFLKSWFHLAEEFFPGHKLVHLIRDPLAVAKSEAYREGVIKKWHVPFCHYQGGDGERYFLWSLTGREPIFHSLTDMKLTRLQWYVVQWIEIENRAMRFLKQFRKEADCFTLQSPRELNDGKRVADLFDFLGLKRHHAELVIGGRRNKSWRRLEITAEDRQEFLEVARAVPREYREIFRGPPYAGMPWMDLLA
jgi:hypothetical protein